jgi:vitamin K-dependent gamma-carboxylase
MRCLRWKRAGFRYIREPDSSVLTQRVDGSSLAVFRVALAGVLVYEVARYFAHGWIREYWIEPAFHFTYFGFEWLRPLPGLGMYVVFLTMGAAALAVAVGYHYRAAAWFLLLAFTYQFLLEQARYLNHFYAATLLIGLLAVVPAHAVWSLDALRQRKQGRLYDGTVPLWSVWLLRTQVAWIYTYAGIAKLNTEWLNGDSWGVWLDARYSMPFVPFW